MDVHLWLKCDVMMWRQRSRVQWLREGDRNSKFFHAQAFNRRWVNRLTALKNSEGTGLQGQQLEAHIVEYFQAIFSTSIDKGPIDFLAWIER